MFESFTLLKGMFSKFDLGKTFIITSFLHFSHLLES